MNRSRLQDIFMRDIAQSFRATQKRIVRRLAERSSAEASRVLEEELRGLYHGLFVTFDGGSSLANEGLLRIVDEDGVEFDRNLHEMCFDFWPLIDQDA